MDTQQLVCPTCGNILVPGDVFCPKCGTKIIQVPQNIGIGRQIYIYVISFLLPPLGLIWTWKYLRTGNSQQKRIGLIAAGLTVISIILTLWATMGFFSGLQSQMSSYTNLGL